jgi:asparagine synthase (glutamine-hydrolysing)
MCGITGILTSQAWRPEELRRNVEIMRDTLLHRGPDDSGVWLDMEGETAVAFGFRRLAILDLSELGHQPMVSSSKRFAIVFNGEVYNFAALRRELEERGVRFRGHSDTEVILEAFENWGVESATKRFVGMFAIALWDTQKRQLHLIRDRMGKKPLFVYARPGVVLFGSELKALRAAQSFDGQIDRSALASYLRHLYVPAPASIYQRVMKIPPGHLLSIADPSAPLPNPRQYWSLSEVARAGAAAPFLGNASDAVDEFERLLAEAVSLRMQSDVPLGALLSGGVDSSLVVALMRRKAQTRIKTFTIGFDAAAHDESVHAAAVAKYLDTDHTNLRLTGADALNVVPMLPRMFDEPLADPSQIPTYLVCALARSSVTVALTGDGGDELFGGYNRYTYGSSLIPRMLLLPPWLRRAASAALGAAPREIRGRLLPASVTGRLRLPGAKAQKLALALRETTAESMYRSLVSAWQHPDAFLRDPTAETEVWDRAMGAADPPDLLDRMMLTDQQTYLPDDLLAKVDRASMAVSLEARVPLLDHRIVEFSWRLPRQFKILGGEGKWLLRQLLYRHVPRELVDRPKVGFSVPIAQWLLGPLRSWADDILTTGRGGSDGMLDLRAVRRAWAEFLHGDGSSALGIWAILMYRAWEVELMG